MQCFAIKFFTHKHKIHKTLFTVGMDFLFLHSFPNTVPIGHVGGYVRTQEAWALTTLFLHTLAN